MEDELSPSGCAANDEHDLESLVTVHLDSQLSYRVLLLLAVRNIAGNAQGFVTRETFLFTLFTARVVGWRGTSSQQ